VQQQRAAAVDGHGTSAVHRRRNHRQARAHHVVAVAWPTSAAKLRNVLPSLNRRTSVAGSNGDPGLFQGIAVGDQQVLAAIQVRSRSHSPNNHVNESWPVYVPAAVAVFISVRRALWYSAFSWASQFV
jgi:hypothetical protein